MFIKNLLFPRIVKFIEMESRVVVARGWERKEWRVWRVTIYLFRLLAVSSGLWDLSHLTRD